MKMIYQFTPERKQGIIRRLAYLFLYVGFIFIIFVLSLYVDYRSCRPMNFLFGYTNSLVYFLIYTMINHILVRKVVPTRVIIIFEILLIVALVAIACSDLLTLV